MSVGKFRTYLPSDDDAPEFIKELYSKPTIDFDKVKLDGNKLIAFERLVIELCHDFTVYRRMFGTEDARSLSSKLGSEVMLVVERALLTQICLRYAALVHDETPSRGGTKLADKEVVSLRELIDPLGSKWLTEKLNEFKLFYKSSGLDKWRNKVIAHNDLKVFQNRQKYVPALSAEAIENQLVLLNDCLNYLKDEQYKYTDVEVVMTFGEGLDRYKQLLASVST